MNAETEERVSLNKVVSGSGFCSRREADKYIETGRVTINNKTARKGAWVKPGDVVAVDGEKLPTLKKDAAVYMAFNKPVSITSTTDEKDKSNIIHYINYRKRIFPIGRLDKDSDGLIILTNDGDIVNKILRASNNHEKEYIVTVDKPVDEAFVRKMSEGVPVLDEITKKCFVRAEGARRFRIVLTQGLNRQIRRMCEYLGYKVHTLTRVRVMNITLGNLGVGEWRYFSPAEIHKMNELITDSTKIDTTPKRKTAKTKAKSPKPENLEPLTETFDDDEPTRPFHEYEEVKRKKKTGNQWWADNKKKPKKQEYPKSLSEKKTASASALRTNKKAATTGKPFKRSDKATTVQRVAHTSSVGTNKNMKTSKGRRG